MSILICHVDAVLDVSVKGESGIIGQYSHVQDNVYLTSYFVFNCCFIRIFLIVNIYDI